MSFARRINSPRWLCTAVLASACGVADIQDPVVVSSDSDDAVIQAALSPTSILEAETMTLSAQSVGTVGNDANASGGSYLKLVTNGSLTGSLSSTAATRLVLRARRESACGAAPRLKVIADGVTQLDLFVTGTAWKNFAVLEAFPDGAHTLKVSFVNHSATSSCQVNVHVDQVGFVSDQSPVTPTPTPTPAPTGDPVFTVTASSVTPSSVQQGGAVTFGLSLRSSLDQSGDIVDVILRDMDHTNLHAEQQLPNVTFVANQAKAFSTTLTVPADLAAGTYCVDVGTFSSGFGKLYFWENCVETVTVTAPAPTNPPPPPSSSGGFQLGQRPFAASSSWNTPIPTGIAYTNMNWPASTGYNYGVSWDGYSAAIYYASPGDPLVSVTYPYGWGYPGGVLQIHMPANADGAPGTDGELVIIDGTTVHNFWVFKRTSATTATAQSYGAADAVTGSGWGSASPFLGAGITAAGSSQLAGILVQAETDSGEIQHALNLRADGAIVAPGAVGRAISADGYTANGIVREGQRLAIPRSTPMPSGLSPLSQKIFRALQNYGAFVTDVSGGCTNFGAQQNAYDDATMTALWHDADKLIPLLKGVPSSLY